MITSEYDRFIQDAVSAYLPNIDYRLIKAQFYQESRFDPDAISPAGARGIAQFMPATWGEWGKVAGYQDKDIHDPIASITTGVLYMSHLRSKWSSPRPEMDRHCLAMASYNAGFGNLLKAQKQSGGKLLYCEIIKELPSVTKGFSNETINYVQNILKFYSFLLTRGW